VSLGRRARACNPWAGLAAERWFPCDTSLVAPPLSRHRASRGAPARERAMASGRRRGRAALAWSHAARAVLQEALCAMSGHTARVPWWARPRASGGVRAGLARSVTWPHAGWRRPGALGPSSPTPGAPCGLGCPSPAALGVL